MFKKNTSHLQIPLTSNVDELPPQLRKRLDTSWSGVFYRENFCRLDETPFAVLFSVDPSRPNVPVNRLVSLEQMKAKKGWSDEEMYDAFCYDLQVRYALGLRQLGEGHFDLRTVYYFRERVSRHMQENGENLLDKAFEQVTDEQIGFYDLKTGRQRMDTGQIASNIRAMGRLQLLVEVLQRVHRMLTEEDKVHYAEMFAPYIKGHAGQYVYRIKGQDTSEHLQKIGEVMQQLLVELQPGYGEEPAYQMFERVFGEHYRVEEKVLKVKVDKELSANSLQSPDDLEATFRQKNKKSYKGYVVNLTETCDPDNNLQLITKVQVASNNTEDADLLVEALPNL
ncbi:MAG: transposase, partial [Deltaproteobacteria bacterium]